MPRGVPKEPKPPVDPLLAALIAKLPATGSEWPDRERRVWLGLMAQAFKLVYGPAEEAYETNADRDRIFGGVAGGSMAGIAADIRRNANVARLSAEPEPPHRSYPVTDDTPMGFVIDPEGYALRNGKEIDANEIPPGTTVYDYRPPVSNPDLAQYSPIMWKSTGAGEQAIPEGVVILPAKEPYKGKTYTGGVMT